VKERWCGFDRVIFVIFGGADEQKRTDARALTRNAPHFGQLVISACPLLGQCRKQGGRSAKHKAQQPYAVQADNGGTGRGRRRWDIGSIREASILLG
jgi:hypothetical protein